MIGTSPLQVSVANGQSTHECPQFVWNMHIHKFVSDVMILPLGGCDMVLGIQWLTTLDDIKWNFKKLVMEFEYKMKKVVLRGTRDITLHWMQGKKSHKEPGHKQAELYSMRYCIYPVSCCQMEGQSGSNVEVESIVEKFEGVFAVPTELPPHRSHDHKIPLLPNTPPINISPYRHPPNQKDAIE